jgi:hypothetical protein
LRRSSIAFRFCLSCQVGDGSTVVGDFIRPRRVCGGESTCRISANGSNGPGTNGRSSKPLGNGGRISPSIVGGGNCDTRLNKRKDIFFHGKHLISHLEPLEQWMKVIVYLLSVKDHLKKN